METWVIYALLTAVANSTIPLLQEKFKADGFAVAFWIKFVTVLFAIPFIIHLGLPSHPLFYVYVGVTAILYSLSDIVYFRAIPVIGSGLVTRLLPASVVITFFLWFIIDPALARTYLAEPWKAVSIVAIMALFTFCATQIKKCAVSWQGVRVIWFVILAACIGPIFSKLSMRYAEEHQAAYAYIFIQAIMMIVFLSGVYVIKKPTTKQAMLAKGSIQMGMTIGIAITLAGLFKMRAIQYVDNPGLASVVIFTDVLIVMGVYKMMGKKEDSNVWAGLGIVACAILVILVRNF
jgi:uncharacterized membrane protein